MILSRFAEAKRAFEHSLKLQPSNAEFYHGMAKALEGMDVFPHDQLKEAIPLYATATKMVPKNPLFQFDLCGAAFKVNEIKQAKEVGEPYQRFAEF